MFTEMSAAYGAGLESQLITGAGQSSLQLLGVASGTNFTAITYTSASPAGTAMWPYFGYAVGQIGDSREVPPEAWLMRTARWAWFQGAEDLQNRPFGLPSPFFLGNTDDTPDPIGGLFGLPVFLDDSIPATLGTGANQDEIICLRPSDLILLEGDFQTAVDTQVLSGSLGARLQLRNNVAAITSRYTTGTAVLGGTGFVVQSNY
jgi:hypothetical protein